MSCQVMYQSYYPYFPHYPQSAAASTAAAASSGEPPLTSGTATTVTPPPPSSASLPSLVPSTAHHPTEVGSPTNRSEENESHRSPGGTPSKSIPAITSSYGAMQHGGSDASAIYAHAQQSADASAHAGQSYLNSSAAASAQAGQPPSASSPHVAPLPASSMAPSVAALQRLSASIDAPVSRSNSRQSAYNEHTPTNGAAGAQNSEPPVNAAPLAKTELSHEDIAESGATGAAGASADIGVEEHLNGARAQYLAANCVVFSFYNGDLASALDEHFSRALKSQQQQQQQQQNSDQDSPSSDGGAAAKHQSDSPVPMSQRNLPASFWISDYYAQHNNSSSQQHFQQQQQQAQQFTDTYDAYMADPWHNYMHYQHHRSTADMYTQASRQYSSLLHLQSSAIARQAQHQAAGRHVAAAAGSAAAAVDSFAASATHPHYTAAMTGLEGTMQGTSKDLYWF